MMEDEKFNLNSIDKTFAFYKKGQMFDGVVVIKRDKGVLFNIGGKNDAFIPYEDFDNYDAIKIGDRFKVVITKNKNEEGFIEASKRIADDFILGNQTVQMLRLGSKFSFIALEYNSGLISKMGEWKVVIPTKEVSLNYVPNFEKLVGKQMEAVVTEINNETKEIVGSVRLLQEQIKVATENNFWNSIFINKIVKGVVKRILNYGCFVEVDGVDCFCHISNLAYERISNPDEVVTLNQEYNFKIINIDHENKKVELSLKALMEDPKLTNIKELVSDQVYSGEVIKLLQFGAIIKLENSVTGLLHISNATENREKKIYEIVKNGDKVSVKVVSVDLENMRVSFELEQKVD